MRCPACGSTDHKRLDKGPHSLRKPVLKGGKTWRVHLCVNCNKMFVSVQSALTPKDAQMWMEIVEAEEAASTQQTAGSSSESGGTPGSSGSGSPAS